MQTELAPPPAPSRPQSAFGGTSGQPEVARAARERAEGEALFLRHLEFVRRVVRSHCRRQALSSWDAEDFESSVMLRLVADDYAVLRRFRGKSRLTTYLIAVVYNAFQDFRFERWGRWRPSSSARRMGELAIRLEALIYRDGLTLTEATRMLEAQVRDPEPERAIERIAVRLRPRQGRPKVSSCEIELLAGADRGDRTVEDESRSTTVELAQQVLNAALQELSPEDRLILKMRFRDGLTVAAIADLLKLDPRRLYKRLPRLLLSLRSELERGGLQKALVRDLLGWTGLELTLDFGSDSC